MRRVGEDCAVQDVDRFDGGVTCQRPYIALNHMFMHSGYLLHWEAEKYYVRFW